MEKLERWEELEAKAKAADARSYTRHHLIALRLPAEHSDGEGLWQPQILMTPRFTCALTFRPARLSH